MARDVAALLTVETDADDGLLRCTVKGARELRRRFCHCGGRPCWVWGEWGEVKVGISDTVYILLLEGRKAKLR